MILRRSPHLGDDRPLDGIISLTTKAWSFCFFFSMLLLFLTFGSQTSVVPTLTPNSWSLFTFFCCSGTSIGKFPSKPRGALVWKELHIQGDYYDLLEVLLSLAFVGGWINGPVSLIFLVPSPSYLDTFFNTCRATFLLP